MVDGAPPEIPDLTGELTLSDDGAWFHNGTRFSNQKLIALFNRSIVFDPAENQFILQVGVFRARFSYADTVHFLTDIDTDLRPWEATFSDGRREPIDGARFSVGSSHQLYYRRLDGHKARLGRSAHQHLIPFVRSEDTIEVAGTTYRIAEEL